MMISTLTPDSPRLKGNEKWPVIGKAVSKKTARRIYRAFAGLPRHWACLEKAQITREILGRGDVMLGSLRIISADGQSAWEYLWNPPYEFHAWVEINDGTVVDFALPGSIEMGRETCDQIGPCLVGRKPVALAGHPVGWLRYHKRKTL